MYFVGTFLKRNSFIQTKKYLSTETLSRSYKRNCTPIPWKLNKPACTYLILNRGKSDGSGSKEDNKNFYAATCITLFALGAGVIEVLKMWKKLELTVPYVIIGNDTTALMAAQGIRLRDPKAKVLMVGEDNSRPHQKSFLSMFLLNTDDNHVNNLEFEYTDHEGKQKVKSSFHEDASYFLDVDDLAGRKHGGVALLKNTKVQSIGKAPSKKILLDDNSSVVYDKCFISAGKTFRPLPVFATASKEVRDRTIVLTNTVEDFKNVYEILKPGKKIAVIGNGLTATELSTTINMKGREIKLLYDGKQNLEVCQITTGDGILSHILPAFLSNWASERFQNKHKLDLYKKNAVVQCEYNKDLDKVELVLSGHEKLHVDHVIIAEETQRKASPPLRRFKAYSDVDAYVVNDQFEAEKDIYIAGEGVVFHDAKLDQQRKPEGQFFEEVIGKLAGGNMAGENRAFSFQPHVSGYFFNDFHIKYFGTCDSSLKTISYFPFKPSDKTKESAKEQSKDKYRGKGVVFYLDQSKVVGVLIWNVTGSHIYYLEDIIRQVLRSKVDESNVHEIAKKMRLNTYEEFYEQLRKRDDELDLEIFS